VPVNGWDTETSDGEPFVLSYAFDDSPGEVLHDNGERIGSERLFRKLTSYRARSSCNVWYNLDFDANVMLAHLPKHVVYHIGVFGSDEWNGYKITYLPRKLLCVRDSKKHKVEHYDVAHIFFQTGGSLDGALQAWLGRRKRNEHVDVKRFGDREYVREHFKTICEYAANDAVDVRDLWKGFASVAEPLEIPCAKPFSTGYLAEQRFNVQFRKPGNKKPSFVHRELQALAWRAYYGGRFEVIERGSIESVASYDINSAYPNVLRTLPDPGSVWWSHRTRPKQAELEHANLGFVRATVTTDPARPLQPFAVRRNQRLTFPILDDYEITTTLPEFLFAQSSGLLRSWTVHEAWLGQADDHTIYPFRFIDEIYAKRQELKRAGNDKAQACLKIIINSMYGKLAQLTRITSRTDPSKEWKDHWIWHPVELFPPHLREWMESEGIEVHQTLKAGAYFNPILAAYVTGLTRLQLLETAISEGIEQDVVLLATDSITFRDSTTTSLSSNLVDDRELGAWSHDASGALFVVGSGVYEMTLPDGTVSAKTRGFEPGVGVYAASLSGSTLRDAASSEVWDADKREWIVPISNDRPLRIKQALWQDIDLSEVGVWRSFPRGLSAGMDRKRLWPNGRHVSYARLLESSERSFPLRWHG
jgi:hypothetical protein